MRRVVEAGRHIHFCHADPEAAKSRNRDATALPLDFDNPQA